ncbi:hypothetical protein RhiirB3_448645 [Rhizophagus irregularis]|nr:hypothetical protein RhiirB3_448645 [Rhizophagus irregularis]
MAYSKIFSGDLPEITNEIIQYFKKDLTTLYSCIFVNRLWCRLAIPLLWENPFSIPTKNYRCIEIYLSYLNDDNKTKFNEYEIINNLLPSNTLLFNYPSFIKCLNLGTIYISTKEWVCTLLDDDREKLEELVYRSLFEIFIKNEGILYSFEIVMFAGIEYFDTMELILQNPNLTYNIKNLTFNIYNISFHDIINIIPFLKFLYSNCNSISSIILNFPIYNINNRSLIEKYLSQIIISQNNLKKISFESNTILYNPFLSLKNSNCSNTLNTIVFYYIDFNDIICIFNEVFNHLNVLESIHILYCHSINSNFIQQINKIIKPFKLKTLFMKEISHFDSLQFLLKKFGNYLENFEFGSMREEYEESRRKLLGLIINYCTNIKRFTSDKPDDNNIYLLIENIGQTINYINIDLNLNYSDDLSLIILQNLGQVLPSKLDYLSLSLSFNTKDFEIFLKNSQNTFIKKLLIRNIMKYDDKSILSYIKKYIMMKEKVKYLAYLELVPFSDTNKDLFYLKDEVNEFKLHNIVVRKYFDLCIIIKDIIYNK